MKVSKRFTKKRAARSRRHNRKWLVHFAGCCYCRHVTFQPDPAWLEAQDELGARIPRSFAAAREAP